MIGFQSLKLQTLSKALDKDVCFYFDRLGVYIHKRAIFVGFCGFSPACCGAVK